MFTPLQSYEQSIIFMVGFFNRERQTINKKTETSTSHVLLGDQILISLNQIQINL